MPMKTRYVPKEERTTNNPSGLKPIKREQWKKIAECLEIGGNLHDAAAYARCSYGRLYRNVAADKHLAKDVAELMADCKMHHLRKVYDGEKGWQSSAWYLERMYRKEYALHQPEMTEDEKAIQVRKIVRKAGLMPKILKPSEN